MEPQPSTPPKDPTPMMGQPKAKYTLFEQVLKQAAKLLRQSR